MDLVCSRLQNFLPVELETSYCGPLHLRILTCKVEMRIHNRTSMRITDNI